MKSFRFLTMLVVFAIALAACTTTAPPTATVEPTATTGPTPVATIPADLLVRKGYLTICTDFPYPPQEYYDENGNPQGVDVELSYEIGNRLGLQVQFVNSVFDTIIAAVTGGKCDIAVSAQFITEARSKQVSMIPYFIAGQSFVGLKGNPSNITSSMDFCGQSVAAESGTSEAEWLQGVGDYEGVGLTQLCIADGKEAPTVVITQKDSDALQQLQSGKVIAYSTDTPVAHYYIDQNPDLFEIVGEKVDATPEGISVPCNQEDCTDAPLTEVGQAIKVALDSMIQDGSYLELLTKWNVQDCAINS
jgi:polar amino acid transport system substrate-binding protein